MLKPILTLTTDFGLSDHYVGAMKGVILSICPQVQIVDITHEVAPFEITEGAYLIAQAWRCFPRKTVHVVVVDPGVGTARRPILMETEGHYFVAPDNGVLSMIYSREKHKIRLIEQTRYFRMPVSHTFHGRDIFAPVAAHICAGVTPARIGKPIQDYLRPAFERPLRSGKHTWNGRILKIDRFGNIVTNFHVIDFPDLERQDFTMTIGLQEISVLARNYAECAPGELFVVSGSSGYLEVSMNQGSAARQIACETGAAAELKIY
ncbi:MAG TPA: SAM-dependent chlorinase/fluorinase [Bryobacteraceae bacterium]|nr:SAM-dependent chlorinase/fluorinase [Bryobacteraceae bacterium]